MKVWSCGKIRVPYKEEWDGGGTWIAEHFVRCVRETVALNRAPFASVLDWASGPGFIGLALLAEGLCRRLVLADVNPDAIRCARRAIARNRLQGRVQACVSDVLDGLPPSLRFDLVVANPPNFCAINPRHPAYALVGRDLRPNDRGWKLRRAFYASVGGFLKEGGLVLASIVEPEKRKVVMSRDDPPYDLRPAAPLPAFRRMAREGGLNDLGTVPYLNVLGRENFEPGSQARKVHSLKIAMVVSRKGAGKKTPPCGPGFKPGILVLKGPLGKL